MANIERGVNRNTFLTLFVLLGFAGVSAEAATINQTLCVRNLNKTMSDGQAVTYWGFTTNCAGMASFARLKLVKAASLGIAESRRNCERNSEAVWPFANSLIWPEMAPSARNSIALPPTIWSA